MLAATLLASSQLAQAEETESVEAGLVVGVVHGLIWYAPNRVLDVLDLVRARVRVGPGAGISLRASEAADLFLGSYSSIYVGLPGPRGRKLPRLPVGLEARSGVEVGLADLSTGAVLGPDYGVAEVGVGIHAAMLGVDVGVDPLEILDLALGFLTIDLRDDDF